MIKMARSTTSPFTLPNYSYIRCLAPFKSAFFIEVDAVDIRRIGTFTSQSLGLTTAYFLVPGKKSCKVTTGFTLLAYIHTNKDYD